jgi:hypothetical protein
MAADDNSSNEAVSLGIMQSLWARFAPGKRFSAAESDTAAKPVSAGSLTAPPALAQSLSPSDSAATLEGGQSSSCTTTSTIEQSSQSAAAAAAAAVPAAVVAGEKAAGAKEVQTAVGAQLKELEVRCKA